MFCLIRTISKAILSVVFSVLSLFIFTANAFTVFSLGWGAGSIATMVWFVGIPLVALKLLPIYEIFDLKYDIVAYSVLIALSLLLIAFRISKLIKTLFIVIGASVTLWALSRHCADGQSFVQGLACNSGVFWVGETLFVFVILL